MKDDVVRLAPLTENAPEGAQEAIDSAKEKILDGSLVIFAGPIKDQTGEIKVEEGTSLSDGEMLSIDWFVNGVVGKIQ